MSQYSRELLLQMALVIHDREVGEKHCDRKYVEVCSVFVNGILRAPEELRKREEEAYD